MPQRALHLTGHQTLVFALIALALGTTLALAAAEGLVRLAGIEPWGVEDIHIGVTPGGGFYTHHPRLGYTHLPGTFVVTFLLQTRA